MNKYILLILLLFLTEAFVSQKSIIVCDQNKQPIEFCNISSTSTIKGCYTNKFGFVRVDSFSPEDTLLISCLGFEMEKYAFDELPDTIFLKEKRIELPEIELKASYTRDKIGYRKGRKIGVYSGIHVKGLISGRILTGGPKGILESVEFFVRKSNENPSCKYAIRIYQLDTTTQLPSIELLDSLLFIPTNKSGWSKVDLSDYFIKYNGSIYVGVECLLNSNFSLTDTNNYEANVSLALAKNVENDFFCLGRNGVKWQILSNDDTGGTGIVPMIRATIKY